MQHLRKFIYSAILLGFVLFAPIDVFAAIPPSSSGRESNTQDPTCDFQIQVTDIENAPSAKNS